LRKKPREKLPLNQNLKKSNKYISFPSNIKKTALINFNFQIDINNWENKRGPRPWETNAVTPDTKTSTNKE